MAVIMNYVVFWDVPLCGYCTRTDVSEEPVAPIFRAKTINELNTLAIAISYSA
jgi:hypothetical protein